MIEHAWALPIPLLRAQVDAAPSRTKPPLSMHACHGHHGAISARVFYLCARATSGCPRKMVKPREGSSTPSAARSSSKCTIGIVLMTMARAPRHALPPTGAAADGSTVKYSNGSSNSSGNSTWFDFTPGEIQG